ncbi:MAG: hypothetical protein MK132_16785 [Lentisphaerales bacterium]|nr:hypothetical protein [Lentisphaerales bacterium]
MNKTVLLACCDFLVLATLSLNYNPQTQDSLSPNEILQQSNEFTITDEDVDRSQELFALSAIYEKQLASAQQEKTRLNEEIKLQKGNFAELSSDYQSLREKYKILLQKKMNLPTAIHDRVNSSRLEVSVSIKEDDSFNPDLFRMQTFTSAASIRGKSYAVIHRKNLGFTWDELVNDGHISDYSLTISQRGKNPWSFRNTASIQILNELSQICLIPLSSELQFKAMPLLKGSVGKHLKSLYALKSDGRLIKVSHATTLPTKSNDIELSEKRFLGQPDSLEAGNVILTESGLIVGLITNCKIEGNTVRHSVSLLSSINPSNHLAVPVSKKQDEKYFSDLVRAVLQTQ